MLTTIKQIIVLGLIFYPSIATATCRLESEIPSSTPSSRFTTHADGTVTDNQTNLMWAKCALGQNQTDCSGTATTTHWQGALQAAETSTLASHSNWRLPNIKELRSIVEKRCNSPAINAEIFPNTPASYFWSASPYAGNSDDAWHVDFSYGSSRYGNGYGRSYGDSSVSGYRDGHGAQVRLVRSGQ